MFKVTVKFPIYVTVEVEGENCPTTKAVKDAQQLLRDCLGEAGVGKNIVFIGGSPRITNILGI